MRAIGQRLDSVAFGGFSTATSLYECWKNTAYWRVPSGAIERRAFQVETSAVLTKAATAVGTVRPCVELRQASTIAGLGDSASVVQRFPLVGQTPVAVSLDPQMYYTFRLSVALPEANGVFYVTAGLTFERQA